MSSIYNTSRTDKLKGRQVTRRATGPIRPGIGTQHTLQQHQLQQQQRELQQQQEEITFSEFKLMSTSKQGRQTHLMDFKCSKHVDPKTFARPVKLHRKETNFIPYRQYIANLNAQNAAKAAKAAEAAANAAAIIAGQVPMKPSNVEDLDSDAPASSSSQHGPKTGADTSLIAPLGGATRNKQMLFKKRTKQIYLAKEDTREIKEQEHLPWILEDYDSQNSFTGSYEGGQRSDYMFFVLTDNGFKVVPVDRWYKFQPKRNFKTLSLEEAEEQLKKQQKRENARWMMMKRESEQDEEGVENPRKSKFKIVDHEDKKNDSDDERGKQDSDIDDIDFDDVFQDDEEGVIEHEVEDEEVKDGKDRVKKEIKGFSIGTQDDDDEEDMSEDNIKLSSEGKQMRKLVRDLEKNRAYESDEEGDPYASSAEEFESDNGEDQNSENENKEKEKENEKEKEKKSNIPLKKKAIPVTKSGLLKKSNAAKIKKEGLSKPIGRPGSPSVHIKKMDQDLPSPSDQLRPSSPLANKPSTVSKSSVVPKSSSPVRPTPPAQRPTSPSSGFKEPSKKRKMEEASAMASKHKKVASSSDGLITEQEVIETLRGKVMTTKDFLLNFRKRIKKDPRNREIITTLLRKIAKSNKSTDPSTRTLELKPEYQ